jgi:hypothetical protein
MGHQLLIYRFLSWFLSLNRSHIMFSEFPSSWGPVLYLRENAVSNETKHTVTDCVPTPDYASIYSANCVTPPLA